MRIYLPSTLPELAGHEPLGVRLVHAVTPALVEALPDEDTEGREYAAQLLAADDSLDLLGDVPRRLRRRVVVAADVPDQAVVTVHPDEQHAPSLVRLTAPVDRADIACAHVDEPGVEADVTAALAGKDDAVERLVERDLLWYDVTELQALARGAVGGPRSG